MLYLRLYILTYITYLLYYIFYNRNIAYSDINIIFIILTAFIFPIISLLTYKKFENILLLLLYIFLIALFNSSNLLFFYIYFEFSLILILIIIVLYGYRFKKYEAYYKLWIYSIIGSIPLFISIIYIYYKIGSLNNNFLELYLNYSEFKILLFFLIILSLIIKLPSYPFHNWLTLAHVEASTIGSIILASIVLKISIYAIYKYNLIILYSIISILSPFFILIGLLSIIIISNLIINQIDLKLIIAYSSIIHTNYMLIGLFTINYIGIYSSFISSIAHGFISTALFFSIGILYNRYKTRIILYYKGISLIMSLFGILFTIAILSNISLPLTSNFIGEILLFITYSSNNLILIIILLIYLILTSSYNLILLNKIIYGKLSTYLIKYHDLTYKEFLILTWLMIINILFGIYPPIFI